MERVTEAVSEGARTGKIGDGEIFVSAQEQVVRIRTGETGNEFLKHANGISLSHE